MGHAATVTGWMFRIRVLQEVSDLMPIEKDGGDKAPHNVLRIPLISRKAPGASELAGLGVLSAEGPTKWPVESLTLLQLAARVTFIASHTLISLIDESRWIRVPYSWKLTVASRLLEYGSQLLTSVNHLARGLFGRSSSRTGCF